MLNLNERCSYKQLLKKHRRKKLRYVLGALNVKLVTQVLFSVVTYEANVYQVLSE